MRTIEFCMWLKCALNESLLLYDLDVMLKYLIEVFIYYLSDSMLYRDLKSLSVKKKVLL